MWDGHVDGVSDTARMSAMSVSAVLCGGDAGGVKRGRGCGVGACHDNKHPGSWTDTLAVSMLSHITFLGDMTVHIL